MDHVIQRNANGYFAILKQLSLYCLLTQTRMCKNVHYAGFWTAKNGVGFRVFHCTWVKTISYMDLIGWHNCLTNGTNDCHSVVERRPNATNRVRRMSSVGIGKHKLSVPHRVCWKKGKTNNSFPKGHRREQTWLLYQTQNGIEVYYTIGWNQKWV